MNSELIEALNILEREKDIDKNVLLDAIENSLITAYKNHFDKADNVRVTVDRQTGDFAIYSEKTVVENVENPVTEISLEDAAKISRKYGIGDVVNVEIKTKEFGRIATSVAKSVITQKIREEEKNAVFNKYYAKEHDIVTGIVQKITSKGAIVNLGKVDALLAESEMIPGETLRPNDRVKVYVSEVKDSGRGSVPKIIISRTNEMLVKRLFENEVAEIQDGIVVIVSISRDPGSRSKISVRSNHPKVEPIGSCVGVNGSRVGAVVTELRGEKIDIIRWSDNSAELIENALSPSKVISVEADDDERSAKVVVPDNQLSLAIGKAGQNAKLAAKLTGYRIDIKSETQARELAALAENEETVEEVEE